MRSVTYVSVCVRVSVCPARALTFESLDVEASVLVDKYIFRIPRSHSCIKVILSHRVNGKITEPKTHK